MKLLVFLMAGAATVAPVFGQTVADPTVRDGVFSWFELTETMSDVARKLGPPRVKADFGKGLESWQYQIGPGDGHEPTHYLVFEKATRKLISVTRNFDPEPPVDEMFPPSQTTSRFLPSNPGFGVRMRRLPGGRVLLAMGSPKPGQPTGQLVLMRMSDAEAQYPWLNPGSRP
ncbi:MAG: hypothetical protein U0Q16_06475 [Bryobacteraceae bacterium]